MRPVENVTSSLDDIVSQSGALDGDEVGLRLLGDGLREQRLTGIGRTVGEDTLHGDTEPLRQVSSSRLIGSIFSRICRIVASEQSKPAQGRCQHNHRCPRESKLRILSRWKK